MSRQIVATNRKAHFKFALGDHWEAGISLQGSEVKSIRDRQASLDEAFARFRDGELYLLNCHVKAYACAGLDAPDSRRPRKLLLHKRELAKIAQAVERSGTTLVPTSLYFNERGIAKVEIAIARTRRVHDKREALRHKEAKREIARNLGRRRGGGGS